LCHPIALDHFKFRAPPTLERRVHARLGRLLADYAY
jgi:hypothetical protein